MDLEIERIPSEMKVCFQNRCVFKLVFKTKKIRKTVPKTLKKQRESIQKFIKNDFHESQLWQYLQSENLDLEVPKL